MICCQENDTEKALGQGDWAMVTSFLPLEILWAINLPKTVSCKGYSPAKEPLIILTAYKRKDKFGI